MSVPDVSGVPPKYQDFRDVFSKAKVKSLPPHHPHECAINLQSGTFPPKGCLASFGLLQAATVVPEVCQLLLLLHLQL